MKPFFSVVIPTYNRESLLKLAIESVLSQSFPGFELIIIDDGSTDNTWKELNDYKDQQKVVCRRIEHAGVSEARNRGIDLASGDYICFLDSDDKWDESKLEFTYDYTVRYPDIKIFHTDEIWFKNGKILNQKKKHKRPEGFIYSKCLPLCCIGMSTSVVRKDLFSKIGLFDTRMPACEDYELWLRACARHEVKLIPEPLTIKDGGRKDQLSNQPGLDKYRIYALKKIAESGILDNSQRVQTVRELIKKAKIYANGAFKRNKRAEAEYYFKLIESYEYSGL